MNALRTVVLLLGLALSGALHAQPVSSQTSEKRAQASEQIQDQARHEARFKHIASELRCLVCQNQTLYDSTSDLANDLRNEVHQQIAQGKSDDDIRAFMVQRYGDFILYKPPVKPTTWLLWSIPFVLLIAGLILLLRMARRASKTQTEEAVSAERLDQARAWLDEK